MKLINKIRSRRGETLVEMLVSITLLVLAMSILAAMLSAAYNSDVSAREMDRKLEAELRLAEDNSRNNPGSGETEVVTIEEKAVSKTAEIDVNVYGNEDELRLYRSPTTP